MNRRLSTLLGLAAALTLLAACSDDEPNQPGADAGTHAGADAAGQQPGLDASAAAPDAGTAGPDAGGAGPDASSTAAPDLTSGTWTLENVSETPDTMSHDGVIAFTDDGKATLAWSEPDAVHYNSDQDIVVRQHDGSGWGMGEWLTSGNVQFAFPSIRAHGDTVHLAYSVGLDGTADLDVFYVKKVGAAAWTQGLDLTSGADATELRMDYNPKLAVGPGGRIAVAYMSHPIDSEGTALAADEIRVIRFDVNGQPTAPVVAIPAPGGAICRNPAATYDGGGRLHVVADCGPLFAEHVYYATDAAGSWDVQQVAAVSDADTLAQIVADPDGTTLHLVWGGELACTGGGACGDVFYARIENGVIGSAVNVTSTADLAEGVPHFAVDRSGRVLVAFQRANNDNFFDIFVTSSADGTQFSAARLITPNTDTQDDWLLSAVAFHPVTNLPQVLYTKIVPMSDPTDSEIMRAVYSLP